MSKVAEIEKEILRLTPAERGALRTWLLKVDDEAWDREIERDVKAGRLDALADAALEEHRKGESSRL